MTTDADRDAAEDRDADAGRDADGSQDVAGDSGYVHRPSGEPRAPTGDRSFDWRGWVLVGTVAVAFLLVPGALLALPAAQELVSRLGLSLRDAYLTLPLIPAFLLGAVAVWSALRSRSA